MYGGLWRWCVVGSMKKWQLSDEGERKHRRDYAVRDGMRVSNRIWKGSCDGNCDIMLVERDVC